MFDFYEFFAGGGMVRAGLGGANWRCKFANDFDHKKSAIYRRNWGEGAHKTAHVRTLNTKDLPGEAHLVWASFPCQDLSLAGGGAGLKGDRSGTFWPFWSLMKSLIAEDRAPDIIAVENVCGTLTSHGGKDFAAICSTFEQANSPRRSTPTRMKLTEKRSVRSSARASWKRACSTGGSNTSTTGWRRITAR